MSAVARFYSSTAIKTTITGSINTTATSITLASISGYPTSFPFSIVLEKDTANEEIISVTAITGSTYTAVRAFDGTTGRTHAAGTTAEHAVSAIDYTLSRSHEAAAANVHDIGATSSVVGTLTAQTLTNKTLGGDLAAGGFKITGLADPASAQDAATKNWAETGMTSQLNIATTQATNSQNSATASALSETNSAASASASQVSRLASEAAKTAAETAETNAEAAETGVAADAATATTQAGISTAQAVISTAQAVISTTQAGISTTKAGESDTSAIASAGSAVQSANSAAAAVAAFDQFDDRFLGSKSSAPSTDNDGDPLVTGALYYNTVEGKMYVWDGSGWLPASAASVISITSFEFTATAGQTAFTGTDANGVTLAFSVGLIQVFTQAQSDGRYYTKAQSDAAFTTPAQLSSVEALALLGL
jgi:hypothetical protein